MNVMASISRNVLINKGEVGSSARLGQALHTLQPSYSIWIVPAPYSDLCSNTTPAGVGSAGGSEGEDACSLKVQARSFEFDPWKSKHA